MDNFLSLAEQADYPYVSCNFVHNGELVFEPCVIREAGGKKIAFVGVITPATLVSSTPSCFRDESGAYVCGFLQDTDGEGVYRAVQSAADSAREEGADFVVVLAHLGNMAASSPWNYADVISHTAGIDVPRSACGTKLACVGWCSVASDMRIETGLYSWNREGSAAEPPGLDNPMTHAVEEAAEELEKTLGRVAAIRT